MGKITVIGSGYKAISHLTHETRQQIQAADVVYYLVDNELIEEFIKENSKETFPLRSFYKENEPRIESYKSMANALVEAAQSGKNVCMLFYGHPGVCSLPGHMAIEKAKSLGIQAVMLPAISAMDCMVADLGIDLFTVGFQSYGANDFINRKPKFATNSHLILWQVGMIGITTYQKVFTPVILEDLQKYLLSFYPKNHPVTYYEASAHVLVSPLIQIKSIEQLSKEPPGWATTLLIPPMEE